MPNLDELNVYRGVMKNKNLSTIISDGLNAPLGSTKRKQAQKVLSIVKKTSMDGKGGPGPSLPRVNVQLRPRIIDYSNFMVHQSTPAVRVKIGDKAPTPRPIYDGQGFPGFGGGAAPIVGNTLNLGKAPVSTAGSLVVPRFNPGVMSRLGGALPALRGGMSLMSGPVGLGLTAASIAGPELLRNPILGLQDRLVSRDADPASRTANTTVPYQERLPVGQTATQNRANAAANPTPSPVRWGLPGNETAKVVGDMSKRLPQRTLPGDPAAGSMTGEAMAPGQMSQQPMSGQFSSLQNAIDGNMGPTSFAYNTLLAEGGSLPQILEKIRLTERKSFKIDEMQGQLNSLVMSGETLSGDLTDYIRGRDEFLNETEDRIRDLKQYSSKADLSDPRNRANMNQQFNYLYEMRGRQNKRYIEFLDMSVNAYQATIDRATNFYNEEFGRYEASLNLNQEIARNDYTIAFQGLQEMYNLVSGAEEKSINKQLLLNQLDQSYLDLARSGIDSEGTVSGSVEDLQKRFTTMNVIDKNGAWVVNNNAVDFAEGDVYRLPGVMEAAIQRAMFTYGEKGEQGAPVSPRDAERVVANGIAQLGWMSANGVISPEDASSREKTLRATLTRTLEGNSSFVSLDQQLPSYLKAIDAFAGDGFFTNRSVPTQANFVKKWGPEGAKLDSGLLNILWTNMNGYVATGLSGRLAVDTFLSETKDMVQQGEAIDDPAAIRRLLIREYANSLQPQAISNFNPVGGGTNQASMRKAAQAIKNIESNGGDYSIMGPMTKGDRAYGAYQVMGNNIPSWTQEALGYTMSPAQFLNNPAAQDKVFNHHFGKSVAKFGNVSDAASVWFSGRPIAKAGNSRDILGTTVPAYVQKFQRSYYS